MSSAWDIKAGKKVWSINEKFPVWSGVLATAGDVVFYGTMDGWFKAVDAKTGWQFKTSSGNHRPAHEYAFGRDLGKEPLAEIKPRRARRREVQLEARMLGEPRLHLGRLDCLFLSMREGLALD